MHSERSFYQGILAKGIKLPKKNLIRLVFICSLPLTAVNSYGQEINPVIEYYLSGSDSVFNRQYIFNTDSRFAFTVTSVFYKTNYRGELKEADTAGYRLYYSGSKLNTMIIVDSATIKDNMPPTDFDVYLPGMENSQFYFFPNDTGAGKLAIGFESADNSGTTLYSGFMNIERETFQPVSLIFYNLDTPNFDRLSETFNFTRFNGYLILSRYEKQGVKSAFLGKSYIIQTMTFSDYELR